jgi:DNA-binding beta-propeller fold protein YncE
LLCPIELLSRCLSVKELLGRTVAEDIYVVDKGNKRVEELTTAGAFVRYIGAKEFTDPTGIAIDSSGNLWITDTDTDEISEYSSTGTYLHSYGGSGTEAGKFHGPEGIVIGANGDIYIADSADEGRVQEFTTAWVELGETTVSGGVSELGFEPETEDIYADFHTSSTFTVLAPALAAVGTFSSIHGEGGRGLAFAKDGDLFVANTSRDCVEIWVPEA